jgi:hypothetical protein
MIREQAWLLQQIAAILRIAFARGLWSWHHPCRTCDTGRFHGFKHDGMSPALTIRPVEAEDCVSMSGIGDWGTTMMPPWSHASPDGMFYLC